MPYRREKVSHRTVFDFDRGLTKMSVKFTSVCLTDQLSLYHGIWIFSICL